MEKENIVNVQWTKDYNKFTKFSYNRPVDENRVDKIKETIKKNGYLVPILADKNYFIIDGQHRLEAVKKLNISFSFILYDIEDTKIPLIISELNTISRSWTSWDYFYMWLDLKKPVYIKLNEIMNNNNIGFTLLYNILKNRYIKVVTEKKFFDGTIDMTNTQLNNINDIINKLNILFNYRKKYEEFGNSFKKALLESILTYNYNQNLMLKALKEYSGLLLKCSGVVEYKIQLEEIYNRIAKKDERIKILKAH